MKTKKAFIRKTMAGVLCVLMLLGTLGVSASAVKLENPQVRSSEATISPDIESEDYYLGSETFTLSDEEGIEFVQVVYRLYKESTTIFPYEESYSVYTYTKDPSDPEKKPLTSIEIEIPYPDGEFYYVDYTILMSNVNNKSMSRPVRMISMDYVMLDALKSETAYGLEVEDRLLAQARDILMNAKGDISDDVRAERDAAVAKLDERLAKHEASKKAEADEKQALLDRVDRLERQLPTWAVILISVVSTLALSAVAVAIFVHVSKKKKEMAQGTVL